MIDSQSKAGPGAAPPAATRDFFTTVEMEERRAALGQLFEDFVVARAEAGARERAQRPWRDSSIAMYRAAWGPFAQYCAQRKLDLADVTVADLEGFLGQRSVRGGDREQPESSVVLNGRYAYRLLSLIDKLAAFDAARRPGTTLNTAVRELIKRDYKTVNFRDNDPLPRFLDKAERIRLVGMLTLPLGSGAAGAPRTWLELRDNAAVAVQLGGGLTPGEVRKLQRDDITRGNNTVPWRLEVAGSGNAPPRHAQLAVWAGRVLGDWIDELARLTLPGPWVFCTERGAQWAKNSCDKASDGVLRRAGVSVEKGHFRLRHTYALIEIRDHKRPLPEVARALGVKDTLAWRLRYERVIDNFREIG
jgi:integrase